MLLYVFNKSLKFQGGCLIRDFACRCFSPLGYVRTYRRVISLNKNCWHRGIVLHHLMHALGFTHENNRPDRDYFVRVIWDNIEEGNSFVYI